MHMKRLKGIKKRHTPLPIKKRVAVVESPDPVYGRGWDASGAPMAAPGLPSPVGKEHVRGWKVVVVGSNPEMTKGSTFDYVGGQEEAQKLLSQVLATHMLPTQDDKERKADPGEFKYKGREKGASGETVKAYFQHKDTRNYLYLDAEGQRVLIPRGDNHFYQGVYDRSEHSSVYAQMRRLSGIE